MTRQDGLTERVRSDICYLAKTHGVSKVILFGSRARGDYHRTSDIDLAVFGGDTVKFSLDVEEKVWTLLRFDVVDLARPMQEALRGSIEKEGITIYEKI